ncbi:ubiquitin carboxyl-terminal hydrolase 42 isoform X2 [Pyxicephalus adspersus]|uniref:ubiquitin carboxyl-terminal hydrolase 42 isoform X2 n=1 Tax=Pyxicephalus adspersus TaxID=30357 RepID=UPI003B59AC86
MIQPPFWAGREQDFCMMCVMQSHIVQALSNTGNVIKPTAVISDLRRIAKHFRLGSQEDAHEFLRYTVDEMQKSCLNGYISYGRSTQATTFIHQVFGGCLRSRVKCLKCKSVSDTYEDCLDIALEIKSSHSISHALEEFVKAEQLDGDNAYKCSKCNQLVTATKKFTIHRLSNVLTLSLKRFASFSGGKLSKEIKYPEYLDIRPYTSHPSGEALIYKLYAVLVHSGFSCHTGHYYSYIKASNDQWYLMNDSVVSTADIRTVLNQQAYLLFYIRSQNAPSADTSYTVQSSSPNSPQPSCSQRASVSKFSFIGPQQINKNVKHLNGNRSPKSSVNGPVPNNNFVNAKRPVGAVPVNRQVSINSAVKKQKITITINKQHPVLQGPPLHDVSKTESSTNGSQTSTTTTTSKPCPVVSTSIVPTQSESKHAPIRLNRGTLVNGKSKVTSNLLVPYGTESSEESEEEQKGIRKRRWSGKCADGTVTTNSLNASTYSSERTDTFKEEPVTPLKSSPTPQDELNNGDTHESSMSSSQNGENNSGMNENQCELSKESDSPLSEDTEHAATAASPLNYACESASPEQRPLLKTEKSVTKPEISPSIENSIKLKDCEGTAENKPQSQSSGSSEDHKRNSNRRSQSFDRSKHDRYRSPDREYRHRDYYSSGHYKHRDYDRQRSRSRGRTGDRYSDYHSKRDRSRSREKHRRHYSPYRDRHYDRESWACKDYKSGWSHHSRGREHSYNYKYNNHHTPCYSRHFDSYHQRKFNGYSSYHQDYVSSKKRKYHRDGSSGEDDHERGFKRQANHNRSPCPRDR